MRFYCIWILGFLGSQLPEKTAILFEVLPDALYSFFGKGGSVRAIRLSTINICTCVLMALVIPLGALQTRSHYIDMQRSRTSIQNGIAVQALGTEMLKAIDLMAEEVRAYAVTQERNHADRYWQEVLVIGRRERVLAKAVSRKMPTEEVELLYEAKRLSDELMGIDIEAMRLVEEARGAALGDMPEAVAAKVLDPWRKAMPPLEKVGLAQELVFGREYLAWQRAIRERIGEFTVAAKRRITRETEAASKVADRSFAILVLLSCFSLLSGLALILLYYFQLSVPIRNHVRKLETPSADEGIPALVPQGASELVALAQAFNERRADRLRFESALQDSERRYRTHLRLMPLAAIDIDGKSSINSWNPAAERMFGYSEEEALGRNIVELIVPKDTHPEIADLIDRLNRGETINNHVNRNIRKDGREIICEWYNTPLYDSRGAWVGWASIVKDVTDQQKEAERILYLAHHDPLTGLLNRRSLSERIEEERLRCARTGETYALIMLDIDKFKDFNDLHGHECGDLVLKSVANAMRETTRSTDSVSRWGGEEFLVLLPATDLEGGRELAEKTRKRIQETELRYLDSDVRVTVTAGVSACDAGAGTIEDHIRSADDALLDGKRMGRNRVVVASRC